LRYTDTNKFLSEVVKNVCSSISTLNFEVKVTFFLPFIIKGRELFVLLNAF